MKRFFVVFFILGLAVCLAAPAFGQMAGKEPREDTDFRMTCGGYAVARDYMREDAWKALTPEQRKKWSEHWGDYLAESLPLRQQWASKRLELQTAWAQHKVDDAKIEKLCGEMADLYAKRMKKRTQHLLKCRKESGDLGWTCPSGR